MTFTPAPSATQISTLICALNASGTPWVLLGDTSGFPERMSGDIDICWDPSSLANLGAVLREWADRNGFHLVQVLQHEICAWYLVFVTLRTSSPPIFIQFDICTDFRRNDRLIFTAGQMLNGRIRRQGTGGIDWFEPRSAIQCGYYVSKRLGKQSVSEHHRQVIRSFYLQDRESATAVIKGTYPETAVAPILKWIERSTEENQPGIIESVWSTPPGKAPTLLDRIRSSHRKLSRYCKPTGAIVHCGGRYAVEATILERWSPAFRHTLRLSKAAKRSDIMDALRRSSLVSVDFMPSRIAPIILSPPTGADSELDGVDRHLCSSLTHRAKRLLPPWWTAD